MRGGKPREITGLRWIIGAIYGGGQAGAGRPGELSFRPVRHSDHAGHGKALAGQYRAMAGRLRHGLAMGVIAARALTPPGPRFPG